VNIQRVERLILDNRRMTCREIAQETNFSTDDEVKQAVL
jgi:hypothetical protein